MRQAVAPVEPAGNGGDFGSEVGSFVKVVVYRTVAVVLLEVVAGHTVGTVDQEQAAGLEVFVVDKLPVFFVDQGKEGLSGYEIHTVVKNSPVAVPVVFVDAKRVPLG